MDVQKKSLIKKYSEISSGLSLSQRKKYQLKQEKQDVVPPTRPKNYLTAEILKLVGNAARENKKTTSESTAAPAVSPRGW
jgi:hypothetical protein